MTAHEDSVLRRRAVIATLAMAATAAAGSYLVPTRRLSDLRGPFRLSDLLPERFGEWRLAPYATTGVVNPQALELANRIYSQLLDRTYVDAQGRAVMLSVAYSADQADPSTQVHYPEVCYPAQGFRVLASEVGVLSTDRGQIKVRRLETAMLERREPLTYWTMVGDQQSLGGWDKKLAELRHGLHGEIVDGLVFRVSSVDINSKRAFELQARFVADLALVLAPNARRQLMGL